VTAVEHPAADRASAYGLERIIVDGNDADAVYRAAMTRTTGRAGGGPSLIECMTYAIAGTPALTPRSTAPRASSTSGRSRSDQGLPRTAPAVRHRDDVIAQIDTDVKRRVDEATEKCKAAPRRRSISSRPMFMPTEASHGELTYRDAVARGIAQEMTRDPDVIFLGEDVGKRRGVQGHGRALRAIRPRRVRDCPISEQAILGAARRSDDRAQPIAEIIVLGFLRGCASTTSPMNSPRALYEQRPAQCPLWCAPATARLPLRRAALAERRRTGRLMIPGLKVVAPSTRATSSG